MPITTMRELSKEQKQQIKDEYNSGASIPALTRKYNLRYQQVYALVNPKEQVRKKQARTNYINTLKRRCALFNQAVNAIMSAHSCLRYKDIDGAKQVLSKIIDEINQDLTGK